MLPFILLLVSAAALVQFGLYYWRATISAVAAQELSERIQVAAGISASSVGAQDFYNILIIKNMSPNLRGTAGGFTLVRVYYSVVKMLGGLIPSMSSWSTAEMATCSRYVAVLIDQHLERNMAAAAQIRGI
jgi:hypothetical protein